MSVLVHSELTRINHSWFLFSLLCSRAISFWRLRPKYDDCEMPSRRLLTALIMGAIFAAFLFPISAAQDRHSPDLHSSDLHLEPRTLLESQLQSFPARDDPQGKDNNNDRREQRIRQWLSDAGCNAPNLTEQSVQRSDIRTAARDRDRDPDRALPPNVICVLHGQSLPGESASQTDGEIIVGAHTDKVAAGDGVIDNWSGAVLLPALFYALAAQPRHHTFVFVGFSAEERGLIGSRYFADHLTEAQRTRIEAVINFDSLAAGPTEFWTSHADQVLVDPLLAVGAATHLPVRGMDVPAGANADSESFARYHIPRITLHSMTDQTWRLLHSPSDTVRAVKRDDYYNSYALIAAYLARLDSTLGARQK
jgi:hypothetical protein